MNDNLLKNWPQLQTVIRTKVLRQVDQMRLNQDKEYGGIVHDKEHTISDYVIYITKQLGKLAALAMKERTQENCKAIANQLVVLIAICMATIEVIAFWTNLQIIGSSDINETDPDKS